MAKENIENAGYKANRQQNRMHNSLKYIEIFEVFIKLNSDNKLLTVIVINI